MFSQLHLNARFCRCKTLNKTSPKHDYTYTSALVLVSLYCYNYYGSVYNFPDINSYMIIGTLFWWVIC